MIDEINVNDSVASTNERHETDAENQGMHEELDFLLLQKIRLRHTAPLSKKEQKSSAWFKAY
jgi:hypothetical protein